MTYYKGEDYDDLVKDGVVLVDFYADWCSPCKMLGAVLEELETDIKILKVNVDEYPELASRFKVMSIPHIIILLHNNNKTILVCFKKNFINKKP